MCFLAEHSRATETLPLETKVVHTPQSGSPINQSRCDGQVDAASDDDEQWSWPGCKEREVEVGAIGASCRRNMRLTN
jgi:hypothetical protein